MTIQEEFEKTLKSFEIGVYEHDQELKKINTISELVYYVRMDERKRLLKILFGDILKEMSYKI